MNAISDHNSTNPVKQHLRPNDAQSPDAQPRNQASSYFLLPSIISSWGNRYFYKPLGRETMHGKGYWLLANDPIDSPSSEIYDACLEMNWDLALRLCHSLPPSALRYQEGDNLETPLYVACQNQPPLHLIQELLTIWPDAAMTKSRQGDIPIHIACRYDADISVLKALLECHPRTATHRTRFGTTPLIALWEPYCRILQVNSFRTNDIMASIAATNPPLYEKYLLLQQSYAILSDRTVHIKEKCQLDIFNYENPFDDKWVVTLELLKAVAAYRENYNEAAIQPSFTPSHLVHAAVALKSTGCPLWVLFYVTAHYNDQYRETDGSGRFPLHIAIGPENSFDSNKNTPCASAQQHWKFIPKEYWSIRLSLYFDPKAASRFDPNEPTGRYPLHTAIHYGHQWHSGVQLLVDAAPLVLHEIDPTIGLYPFQLAATICTKNNSTEGLDLIYELVRYDPTVLEFCRIKTQSQASVQCRKMTTEKKHCHIHQVIVFGSTVVLAIGIIMASKKFFILHL